MNAAIFNPGILWPSDGTKSGLCTRVSLVALLLVACDKGTASPVGANQAVTPPGSPTGAETSSQGPIPSTVPSIILIGSESQPFAETSEPCVDQGDRLAAFEGRRVMSPTPILAGRALYSWTTTEQAAELQAGGALLSRTERPGMGPGHAIEYLTSEFYPASDDEQAVVDLLLSPEFARVRYAWPNAWATRMGWPATSAGPAESYGNQLLRISIKPEAIWVVIALGQMQVYDSAGQLLSAQDAVSQPERVVGVYFHREGDVRCGGSFGLGLQGSAYREFIVMNPDMVESWALGTQELRDVVQADIELLTDMFEAVRECGTAGTLEQWGALLVCGGWTGTTQFSAYESALALVNELYLPRPAEIADIISTLQSDLEAWEAGGSSPGPDAGAAGSSLSSGATSAATATASQDASVSSGNGSSGP